MTATKLFYTVFFPKKIPNQFLFSFFMPLIFSLYWNCILQVTFTEEHVSFLHFLTNVCAIVGGMQMDQSLFVFSLTWLAWIRSRDLHHFICLNLDITILAFAYRNFHCFWNTRFIYLSWPKGYQEEDGTRQI